MGWKVKFVTEKGEQVADLDALSPETYEAIAKSIEEPLTYWDVYARPFAHGLEASYVVLDAAADLLGIDHVERTLRMGDLNKMIDFDVAIADEPSQDGFPQVPGETESGSSSGAPGDSDGTESSAEGSLSATS